MTHWKQISSFFTEDLKFLNSDGFSGNAVRCDVSQLVDGYVTVGGSDRAADSDVHSTYSRTLLDKDTQEHVFENMQKDDGDLDSERVNFDIALGVALNSTAAEPPRQVWETGISKHIFGNSGESLDFDV